MGMDSGAKKRKKQKLSYIPKSYFIGVLMDNPERDNRDVIVCFHSVLSPKQLSLSKCKGKWEQTPQFFRDICSPEISCGELESVETSEQPNLLCS